MKKLLLLTLLVLVPGCCELFGQCDDEMPIIFIPGRFSVSVQATLASSTPGVSGDLFVTCFPPTNPNCGLDGLVATCIYKVTVDGLSRGNALSTNSFYVSNLPPKPTPGYAVVCEHERTDSDSDAQWVIVP